MEFSKHDRLLSIIEKSGFGVMLTSTFSRNLRLLSKGKCIPHPAKESKGGEDSFFIGGKGLSVGVADGVGGWSTFPGGNSAKYSRDLMRFCSEGSGNALKILERAFQKVDKRIIGSTTACVVTLEEDLLTVANVGDSAAMVIRDGNYIFKTKSTTHYFNCPYQLGYGSTTRPADGTLDKLSIKTGDLLLLGTDGLWDNVSQEEILEVIKKHLKNFKSLDAADRISGSLATLGRIYGADPNKNSPFAEEAKAVGLQYEGGKLDDVTVIASLVVEDDEFSKVTKNIKLAQTWV